MEGAGRLGGGRFPVHQRPDRVPADGVRQKAEGLEETAGRIGLYALRGELLGYFLNFLPSKLM